MSSTFEERFVPGSLWMYDPNPESDESTWILMVVEPRDPDPWSSRGWRARALAVGGAWHTIVAGQTMTVETNSPVSQHARQL